MANLIKIVQDLAETIGPRPPTSAAEAEAAAYVNAHMRQAGMDVDVQLFHAVPTTSIPYGLIYLACTLTPLVYYYSPPAALGVSLFALAAFVLETLSIPVLSAWLPGGQSQNVVGTRPAAQESYQHLVLTAHLDSARASLPFHPRLIGSLRRTFLLTAAAIIALPILVGMGWWIGQAWLWYAQWAPAALLALALLTLLHRDILMPCVAGANDNASGVAVLLHMAQELKGLQNTDLWLVATGCKEAGLHGVRHFLRQYPFPRDHTYLVNLDTVGRGQLYLIVREGMLWTHRADPHLDELAGRAEADDITIDADPRAYRLLNSDAQAAMIRGFRAITVTALEGGRPANWHWPTDTLEHIQPELLERTTCLVEGIARRLDRLATERQTP